METSRISRIIAKFNAYVRTTFSYLFADSLYPNTTDGGTVPAAPTLKNWQRLGLLENESKGWAEKHGEWEKLYEKYIDPNTSSSPVKLKVKIFMKKDFNLFAQPLLNRIAADPDIQAEDEYVFNIKGKNRRDAEPSPFPPVTDPTIGFLSLGGGDIDVKVRLNADQTRPSVPHPGVIVQVQYALTAANDSAPPFIQCVTQFLSTHAHFILHLGVPEVGKRFYGYFRWYDTVHPANSGPWTPVQTIIVA